MLHCANGYQEEDQQASEKSEENCQQEVNTEKFGETSKGSTASQEGSKEEICPKEGGEMEGIA